MGAFWGDSGTRRLPAEDKEMDEWLGYGMPAAASTGRLHFITGMRLLTNFSARVRLFPTAPTFLVPRTTNSLRSLPAKKVKGIFCWCSKDFLNLIMWLVWFRTCVLTRSEIEAREAFLFFSPDQNHCIPARFSLCQLLLIQHLIFCRCCDGVTKTKINNL